MSTVPDETKEIITLHGLGFVQVKLGGNQRLHVWHPDLPRRKCFASSQIHDHRFGFTSRVLVGTQINTTYELVEPTKENDHLPRYVAYLHEGARTRRGNRPWVANRIVCASFAKVRAYNPGEEYTMESYVYHSTEPHGSPLYTGGQKPGDGRVATLMMKTTEGKAGAHSLCRTDTQPDVNFDRHQWGAIELWNVVMNVLGNIPLPMMQGVQS